jgi:cation diffusion facilitator CzcD-associated flavoprotein CzcO
MPKLPSHARVVIIGGGVGGIRLAFSPERMQSLQCLVGMARSFECPSR